MKTYEWILFDADGTLFHFDAFQGLQTMFAKLNVPFTKRDYQKYQALNQSLWDDYQKGAITASQLQQRRFNRWATQLQLSAHHLNSTFQSEMANICTPIEGAVDLLNSLKDKTKLGIITNGFIELQQARLERTGLQAHFEVLVISEQVGMAKPHPAIFNHALSLMGNPAPAQVLMVGDNPETDIVGGLRSGFDTCWLNRDKQIMPKNILPHYEVNSLFELQNILCAQSMLSLTK